jgi:methyltransferase (TIGR00027 family)
MKKRIETATSRTAEWTCCSRAASSLEKNRYYHSDDHIAFLLLPRFVQVMARIPMVRRLYLKYLTPRGVYEYVIARTKYIDEICQKALEDQFDQILILGAGFDTRALRFQDKARATRFFELDAPHTQQAKLAQYKQRGLEVPANVTFIPVDFEKESLSQKLEQTGFQKGQKSLFILEGLLMYLLPGSVWETLETIRQYAGAGSRIVFDYVRESVLRGENTRYGEANAVKSVSAANERWQFGLEPTRVADFLSTHGMELIDHKDSHQLEEDFFQDAQGQLVGRINGTHCLVTAGINS